MNIEQHRNAFALTGKSYTSPTQQKQNKKDLEN
jgi:hypothetical protein